MCVCVCVHIYSFEKTVFLLNNSAVKMTISSTHVTS